MHLDFTRIESAVDLARLRVARVGIVGVGGSVNLVQGLCRSGVGGLLLIDPDHVAPENLVRQEYIRADLGRPKVEALAAHLREIDERCEVEAIRGDVTRLGVDGSASFGRLDLLIATTDRFAAQARVNELALEHQVPAIWAGVYEGGVGGEVIFWRPGLPCYRCLVSARYRAHEEARERGESLDPPSDGVTIFDDGFIDCIAGMLALGLLTMGSNGRFGRLVGELGDRNFMHVKIDPSCRWRGRDVTREQLGIPDGLDTFFGWNTAVRRDPDRGTPPCPDCVRFGHTPGVGFVPPAATAATAELKPMLEHGTFGGLGPSTRPPIH